MNKKQKAEEVGRAIDMLSEWMKLPTVKNKITTPFCACDISNYGRTKVYKKSNGVTIPTQKGNINVWVTIVVEDGIDGI